MSDNTIISNMKHHIYNIAIILSFAIIAISCNNHYTTPSPTEPISDTIRLVFGGDLMQHMPQVEAARTEDGGYDYSRSVQYISPMFRSADVAVLNLETTITTTGRYSGYPCFASPVELVDELENMGIDIALLANNHCCDRSSRGIATTIDELNKRNIGHTGVFTDSLDYDHNNIYRFEVKGVRFALVNYTYGTNGIPTPKDRIVNLIDDEIIRRDLRSIPRDSVDCIIACMHWGNEYERHENREQRRLAELLHKEGIDIIIGSHPHVVQPYYADSTSVTFYSLGNLVSNQRRRYCDGGLIAEVKVIRSDTVEGLRYSAEAHPVWVLCPDYRILPRSVGDTLAMPAESRKAYELFMSDTDKLLGL